MANENEELTTTEEIIDVDLDERDAQLREAAGKQTVLRLRGVTVHVDPPKLWREDAMYAVEQGDLGTWARLTLEEYDELVGDPNKADDYEPLRLYELEAIFEAVSNKNGMRAGKSTPSSRSSKKRRKR